MQQGTGIPGAFRFRQVLGACSADQGNLYQKYKKNPVHIGGAKLEKERQDFCDKHHVGEKGRNKKGLFLLKYEKQLWASCVR